MAGGCGVECAGGKEMQTGEDSGGGRRGAKDSQLSHKRDRLPDKNKSSFFQ